MTDQSANSEDSASNAVRRRLRALPSVDDVLGYLSGRDRVPQPVAVQAARDALTEARATIRSGGEVDEQTICSRAGTLVQDRLRPHLRSIINATGVIVSTNLGRAPLGAAAVSALSTIAEGYSNLEYDTLAGTRGSRQTAVRDLLCGLTGAEDALVVNNNAAALLVILAALAADREVVVSRGQLVEIGGGFRIPDVMRQSGARMVEVGTTNRTRIGDFAEAVTPETAILLMVHPSNFRMIGFTQSPNLSEMAELAHERGLLLVHDVGSGCLLDTARWGLMHEPMPQESLREGADIVCFSADKLLGGPQAGIIVGREVCLRRIAGHPLMRAVRSDKLTLAALSATLGLYRDGVAERELPIWRSISAPIDMLRQRAERWAELLCSWGYTAAAASDFSTIGGGSLPGETLPTVVCALELAGSAADDVARELRQGTPGVVARVSRDRMLLDPRTVAPNEDELLLQALAKVLRTQADNYLA